MIFLHNCTSLCLVHVTSHRITFVFFSCSLLEGVAMDLLEGKGEENHRLVPWRGRGRNFRRGWTRRVRRTWPPSLPSPAPLGAGRAASPWRSSGRPTASSCCCAASGQGGGEAKRAGGEQWRQPWRAVVRPPASGGCGAACGGAAQRSGTAGSRGSRLFYPFISCFFALNYYLF